MVVVSEAVDSAATYEREVAAHASLVSSSSMASRAEEVSMSTMSCSSRVEASRERAAAWDGRESRQDQ